VNVPDPRVFGSRPHPAERERIRCYVRLFDADILTIQEIEGEAALSWAAGTDVDDLRIDDCPRWSLNGQRAPT
jgi:hypothetical protein